MQGHQVAGQQFKSMVKYGMGGGDITELEEKGDAIDVDALFKSRMLVQRFQLRTKKQDVIIPVIVQRFHSRPVADQDQLVLLTVVKRDGKHADELIYYAKPPAMIPFQDDFRIRPGQKSISFVFQFLADLLEIVDLPVEIHDKIAEMHRLVSQRRKIEDRQSSLSETDRDIRRIVDLMARIIRPSFRHTVRHPLQDFRRGIPTKTFKSSDTT